ncbi:putative Zn-dependent protease [Caldisphaera lagunensis DSM 15908]|uniref:Putative Zn-dependent protease n=1 Tax=Caldisphaera lagunensis (strain DSM 15908 / JCM 11604 / ANMR 0165 / IC-154) TaxID=1056495 RepID=L0A938_CALLD|nr:archaemetzincin family Zn-dependent metalloprotease [Caldisphaera lagunensis]AFZ70408.1 putative Zn-dependent protease [Caldisphaera lagunensis DSM 15908]
MIEILLQPIGDINLDDVDYIIQNIPNHFPFEIKIYPHLWSLQPPFNAYNINRMQYDAEIINKFLYDKYKEFLSKKSNFVLGVSMLDGYYFNLNFVFGLANIEMKVASIYTKRLKNFDQLKYRERILKESIHEIGHLFGLKHCNTYKCVMNFSNSVDDVDNKNPDFCDRCKLDIMQFYESTLRI